MAKIKLVDTPQETWGNTILYALALQLRLGDGGQLISVDPDQILEEALEIIANYQDLANS